MNKNISTPSLQSNISTASSVDIFAKKALDTVTILWFIIAVAGQWLFAYYIAAFYGRSGVAGNFKQWEETLEHGFVQDDFIGNLMIAMHIILAFIITLGGPLQIIPKLRNRFPKFHRWNGRIYVVIALLISIAGAYIIIFRGVVGGTAVAIGNFINAALIITSAVLTWKYAVDKKMAAHRRWSLRLFVLVSGVWFFRLGFAFWILINQGAPGHTDSFDGPFDLVLSYGHTLLPLAILELYFLAEKQATTFSHLAMAGFLALISLLMAAAIFAAGMVFWLPLI